MIKYLEKQSDHGKYINFIIQEKYFIIYLYKSVLLLEINNC